MSEPLTERATLHRAVVKVRPLPGHPLYWKMQFGFLRAWLFANSPEDAAERATKIIDELPYERVGDKIAIEIRKQAVAIEEEPRKGGPSGETLEQMALREELALESGLSLMLIVVPIGADEAAFEKLPL